MTYSLFSRFIASFMALSVPNFGHILPTVHQHPQTYLPWNCLCRSEGNTCLRKSPLHRWWTSSSCSAFFVFREPDDVGVGWLLLYSLRNFSFVAVLIHISYSFDLFFYIFTQEVKSDCQGPDAAI